MRAGIESVEAHDIEPGSFGKGPHQGRHCFGMIVFNKKCPYRRVVGSKIYPRDRNFAKGSPTACHWSDAYQPVSSPGKTHQWSSAVLADVMAIPCRQKVETREDGPILDLR